MAFAPLQQATATGTAPNTSTVVTMGAVPVAGNTLTLFFLQAIAAVVVSSITQTGVTWTKRASSNVNMGLELWQGAVSLTVAAGTAITVNHSVLVGSVSIAAQEWPGGLTVNVASSNTGTSANPATGTITPATPRYILVLAATRKSGAFNTGPTNSYIALTTPNTGAQMAYLVMGSSAGTTSTDWTYSTSTAWDAIFATFVIAPKMRRTLGALGTRTGTRRAQ